ncbi:phage major capsid protein [Paraburkholderia sp. EG286B]|uniref:phage major capsid protein n=1 Tax=Paraburkholderia sp. EG286B TaxID=3237011 RepID=UPI0034D1CD95
MDLSEIKAMLDSSFGDIKTFQRKLEDRIKAAEVGLIDLGQRFAGLGEGGIVRGSDARSMAALILKHDALATFRAGARTVRADVPDLDVKAALLSTVADAGNGYPVLPQQVLPAPLRPPRLWAALASTPTGSNALQVIDMNPEGGAAVAPEGSTKPELVNKPSPRLVPVDTIAVHKTLSWQLFEDAPALEGFLQSELLESCNDAMDAACVAALEANSTEYTPAAGGTVIDAVLNVIGAMYGAGGNGIVVGLNPLDWIGMLTAKDSSGAYLVNPLQGLINGVAGATIAPTNAVPQGEFVAAASPAGAFVALRKGFAFEWSREHASNFTQNLITFLMEMRAATVVQQVKLVYTGSLMPAGTKVTSTSTKPATK